jgi:hypothetical protein
MLDSKSRYDVLDVSDGGDAAVELAHAVPAKVAAELAGIPVALIESAVADHGSLGVSSYWQGYQELEVRRTRDDP